MYERNKLIRLLFAAVCVLACSTTRGEEEISIRKWTNRIHDVGTAEESQQVAVVASHKLVPAEGQHKESRHGAKHGDYHDHHKDHHGKGRHHKGETVYRRNKGYESNGHGKHETGGQQGFHGGGGKHQAGKHQSHKKAGKHQKGSKGSESDTKGHQGRNRKGYLDEGFDDLLHKEDGGYKGESNYGGSYYVPYGGTVSHSKASQGHDGGHHKSGGQHGEKHHGHHGHHGSYGEGNHHGNHKRGRGHHGQKKHHVSGHHGSGHHGSGHHKDGGHNHGHHHGKHHGHHHGGHHGRHNHGHSKYGHHSHH